MPDIYQSNGRSAGEVSRSVRPYGSNTLRAAHNNIIHFPPAGARSAPRPTSGLTSRAFFSTLKQWAIDLAAITAWCVLTVVTAGAIVGSIFLLLSPL